jgi:Tol biopolymer transport system component
MIMKTLRIGLFGVALTLLMPPSTQAQTGHDLFQQALVKEQAEGNLQEALRLYERIAEEFGGDRPLAARALVQIGKCHEKLGSREAERAYRRVVTEYADQNELAEEARTRLNALSRPAAPRQPPTIQVRRLMGGHYPDEVEFSGGPHPDGRQLSYVDWMDGSLAIRNLATGESRRLTEGNWEEGYPGSPKVSPDGRLIAYYWYTIDEPGDDASGTMLRLVGTDGSGDRFLQHVGGIASGSWSRDSRHLAAHMHNSENSDTEIVWISVADGSVSSLTTFHYPDKFGPSLSHSPDDRFLAVEFPVEGDSARFDIALVATDGSGTLPLVDHPADDKLIGWVPGTDMVLFSSDRSGNQDLWALQVPETGTPGEPFPVRRGLGEGYPMGFAADGSLFYYIYTLQYVKRVAPFDEQTGTIFIEESEPLRGTHDNNPSAWSPDGRQLVLAYREGWEDIGGEKFTVRVRNLDTETERVLTRDINPATVAGPRWLPDGRSVLIVGRRDETGRGKWGEKSTALFRIDVETGGTTRLFDFPASEGWWVFSIGLIPTLDGKGVFYVHNRTLVLRDLQSGEEEELFRHPDLASGMLALSPDGSELLFGIADSTVSDQRPQIALEQGGRLMVMPSTGGTPRELTKLKEPGRVRRGAMWTSDGRHILLLKREEEGSALLRVPREGGDFERIWETDLRLGGVVPSPDGRRVTYMTQTNEAEIWVMENLVAALKGAGGRD